MRLTRPIAALAAGAFGIGTTEFVIMGLLPEVAGDLHVSIPAAGVIVTGYALGVVVGAPLLAVLMARWPRKASLVALMGLFVAGNLACGLAPTYSLLMAARILTALSHGAFFGVGAIVAAELVPERQRAQAIALMFAGLTVANIVGVPIGTLVGQSFGWRVSFLGVSGIGMVALAAMVAFIPANLSRYTGSIAREFRVLGNARALLTMAMSAACTGCLFSLFTYVTPLLTQVTGLTPGTVAGVLLLYGVAITVGMLIGGRLADWRLLHSVTGLFAASAVLVGSLHWTLAFAVPAVATLVIWCAALFAASPGLQLRVTLTAGEAPNLAPALNQSAFNIGCASGAWLGGLPIEMGLPLDTLPLLSAGVALLGVGLAFSSQLLDRRAGEPAKAGSDPEPEALPVAA